MGPGWAVPVRIRGRRLVLRGPLVRVLELVPVPVPLAAVGRDCRGRGGRGGRALARAAVTIVRHAARALAMAEARQYPVWQPPRRLGAACWWGRVGPCRLWCYLVGALGPRPVAGQRGQGVPVRRQALRALRPPAGAGLGARLGPRLGPRGVGSLRSLWQGHATHAGCSRGSPNASDREFCKLADVLEERWSSFKVSRAQRIGAWRAATKP